MAPSKALLVALVGLAASALACDALLGLGNYKVADSTDGSAGGFEAGDDAGDSSTVSPPLDAAEAGDAQSASDADDAAETSTVVDASFDGPPLTALWAQWPMPNPDASSAPSIDGSPGLPNTMAYDAGGPDAATAFDQITHLTWWRTSQPATTFAAAAAACNGLGTGWHVPTRIQLVSLIDFTQPQGAPTIDTTTFSSTQALLHWTASQVPGDAAVPLYWAVDFGTGLVQQRPSASYVLCVKETP